MGKSEDDGVRRERVMTESDGFEAKGKRKKIRGVHNNYIHSLTPEPKCLCALIHTR